MAGEYHAQTGVFQPVADGAVDRVRHREGSHPNPIFLVYDPGYIRLKLMRLHVESPSVQIPKLGAVVPCCQLVSVFPGMIDTRRAGETSARPSDRLSDIPVGRMGQPQDIASLCTYLCSDAAGFLTGQTIHVNGGERDF